jgi:hypothetical protein
LPLSYEFPWTGSSKDDTDTEFDHTYYML